MLFGLGTKQVHDCKEEVCLYTEFKFGRPPDGFINIYMLADVTILARHFGGACPTLENLIGVVQWLLPAENEDGPKMIYW
ncbi:hypothetical protein ACOSQ2_026855 [Xanthoceras sorbifolium]